MRQKRLTQLIALSALSAIALYIVQGALATGADVSEFPMWFWVLDYCLWGARALIEAAVIVYLFSTEPQTLAQKIVIGALEFALVALIALTVGPALRAVGLGVAMRDSVSPLAFAAWCFGIAAYTPLMVGSAGYAYRVQPDGADAAHTEEIAALKADHDAQMAQVVKAHAHEVAQIEGAVEAWGLLDKTGKARLIAACANGNKPAPKDVAEAIGMHVSTAGRAMKIE